MTEEEEFAERADFEDRAAFEAQDVQPRNPDAGRTRPEETEIAGSPEDSWTNLGPMGPLRARIGAFRQGATGWGPQIAGAADTVAQTVLPASETTESLTGGPTPQGDWLERYRANRDREKVIEGVNRENYPKGTMGAEIAGALVPIPGPGKVRAAGKLATIGKGMLRAGGQGVVQGAGRSEGDLTEGEFGKVAQDAAVGGGLAAGGAGLLQGGAMGVKWLGEKAASRTRTLMVDLRSQALSPLAKWDEKMKDAKAAYRRALLAPEEEANVAGELLARKHAPFLKPNPQFNRLSDAEILQLQKAGKYRNIVDMDFPGSAPRPKFGDEWAKAEALMKKNANERMKTGAQRAVVGGVGGAALGSAGFPMLGSAFGGVVGGQYGVREIYRGITNHPGAMRRLMALRGAGPALGAAFAKGEQAAIPVLYSYMQKDPEVRAEVDRIMAEQGRPE